MFANGGRFGRVSLAVAQPLRGFAAVGAILVIGTGCLDLDVANPNQPDRARALKEVSDLEGLLASAFNPFFTVTHTNGAVINVWTATGAESTGVGRLLTENAALPRPQYRNANVPAAPTDNGNNIWRSFHQMPSNASDAIRTLDELGAKLTEGTPPVDVTPRGRAFAKFVQGVGWGYAAIVFDQVVIVDETQQVSSDPAQQALDNMLSAELGPKSEAVAKAIAALDAAIAIARQSTFTFPSYASAGPGRWFGTPTAITSAQFVKLANTMAARILVLSARNPQQRKDVDWAKVLAYTSGGLDFDFEVTLQQGNRVSTLYDYAQNDQPGCQTQCQRVNNLLVGQADVSGAYQAWVAAPLNLKDRFDIVTPDRRVAGPAAGQTGSYIRYVANDNGFPTTLAQYAKSAYQWYRHENRGFDPNQGTAKLMYADENTLLRAEALLRTGDMAGAAALINVTRTRTQRLPDNVTYPGLPAVTTTGVPQSADCVPRTDTGACGDLMVALRYERMLELLYTDALRGHADSRGFGLLPDGTFTQAPVVPLELEVLKIPEYTFGGVGGPWGAVYKPRDDGRPVRSREGPLARPRRLIGV